MAGIYEKIGLIGIGILALALAFSATLVRVTPCKEEALEEKA